MHDPQHPFSDDPEPLDTRRSPLPHSVDRLLDLFLTERLRGQDPESHRARALVAAAVVMVVISLAVLLLIPWRSGSEFYGWPLPRSEVASLSLTIVVGLSLAYIVRRTGSTRSTSWLLPVSGLILITHFAMLSGGSNSPVLGWLTLLPMVSAFLAGGRTVGWVTAAALVVLYVLHLADVMAWTPPRYERSGAEARDDLLRTRVMIAAAAAFLGWYYEQLQHIAADRLNATNQRLEATNDALRVSRLHLRQIAENIGQAIWMEEPVEGRILYVNPSFELLYGVSASDLQINPHAWRRVVVPADRGIPPDGPDGKDHLYRIAIDDDGERWVRHACWRAEGSSKRVIHIAADVTLRRHAESLRERFLEAVLEVQENERRHLARELHDETGQALTALLVGLRAMRNGLDNQRQAHVETLATQLRQVIGDLGRLARGLHPSVLDELGLTAGLQRLGQDLRNAHAIDVDVRVSGPAEESGLSPQQRLALYRIAQEALTNVARHAHARRADVSVDLCDDEVCLRIEDDGRGFDIAEPSAPPRDIGMGLGLHGMRERATLLGGALHVESAPGRGTTVFARIPRQNSQGTSRALIA